MGVEEYLPGELRPFVDSNKRSLKCVLLYNGNECAHVPIRHIIHMKENYEEIKTALNLLKLPRGKIYKFSIRSRRWLHP